MQMRLSGILLSLKTVTAQLTYTHMCESEGRHKNFIVFVTERWFLKPNSQNAFL